MRIDSYLIEQRRRLIQSYRLGFDPNPGLVPRANIVADLREMRQVEFLTFWKELNTDSVVIFKVLTAIDIPALQEGLLIANLRGNVFIIDLSSISGMSDDERRSENGVLQDVRTLLLNPTHLKVVDNVTDVLHLGERIFAKLDVSSFTPLQGWHPRMGKDFYGCVRYEFPKHFEPLTIAFHGLNHYGWRWDMNPDPSVLSVEQARLAYAMGAALIGVTMDRIVLRTFGTNGEREPVCQLAEIVDDAMIEEALGTVEKLQRLELASVDNSPGGGT